MSPHSLTFSNYAELEYRAKSGFCEIIYANLCKTWSEMTVFLPIMLSYKVYVLSKGYTSSSSCSLFTSVIPFFIFNIKYLQDITNNSTKLLYNISTRTIPRGAIFHVCPEAITYNINRRKKKNTKRPCYTPGTRDLN